MHKIGMGKIKRTLEISALIMHGFTYKTASEYLAIKSARKGKRERAPYSLKEIMSILPFNRKFDKYFDDLLSMQYLFYRYKKRLPKYYYLKLKKDGKDSFCPLMDAPSKQTLSAEELISFIRKKGVLDVKKSDSVPCGTKSVYSFSKGSFYIDGKKVPYEDIYGALLKLPWNHLIMEHVESIYPLLHITVLNKNGESSEIIDEYPDLEENQSYLSGIRCEILEIAANFPEIEYMHYTVSAGDGEAWKILGVNAGIDLAYRTEFNSGLRQFIDKKIVLYRENNTFSNKVRIARKYIFSLFAKKKGFEDFMYKNWLRGKREDNRNSTTGFLEKGWAHRKGFYSYRIKQYGITHENYRSFLSDYDYKRLRPLNNVYKKWFQDKLSLRRILEKYREILPEYYFHLFLKEDKLLYFKMEGCPAGIEKSAAGICELLKIKGKLALKPTIGSHGEGFYKLEYAGGRILVNGNPFGADGFKNFICDLNKYYLVTEYVEMNKELKKIYSEAACTVRVMVINRSGGDPVIENVYFRIGSEKTKPTDNLASGGIFARVDRETGVFGNAEIIDHHTMYKCPVHPDTKSEIAGKLPHWKEIDEKIVEICKYISPLEYLGFDVVITDTGFKILEINTHQDLHRYPEYNDDVKAYFQNKLTWRHI